MSRADDFVGMVVVPVIACLALSFGIVALAQDEPPVKEEPPVVDDPVSIAVGATATDQCARAAVVVTLDGKPVVCFSTKEILGAIASAQDYCLGPGADPRIARCSAVVVELDKTVLCSTLVLDVDSADEPKEGKGEEPETR